jgi:hypothetical protein
MRSILNRGEGDRGQILALFAFGAVALILVIGLVIDGGTAMVNRRDGQNAADTASMAATKSLADFYIAPTPLAMYPADNHPYQKIIDSMGENNCPSGGGSICSWTARYVGQRQADGTFLDLGQVFPSDVVPPGYPSGAPATKALGIKVDVTRTPSTYFLGIVDQGTWTVNTTATAITTSLSAPGVGDLLPIAFVNDNPAPLVNGDQYPLTSGKDGPGNFGWLSWTGSNDPGTLANSICQPDSPGMTLPSEYPGDPGKSNSSGVRACLDFWEDSGDIVLIPIVCKAGTGDPPPGANCVPGTPQTQTCHTGGNGNNFTYCIHSIGAFQLINHAQPAVDQINAIFVGTIPWSVGDTYGGGSTAQPPASGQTYSIGLVQ